MPFQKNKQQAFQAAGQGTEQVKDSFEAMDISSGDYGTHLKHLKNEVNEAYQQINNALGVASETQKAQLRQYQKDIQQIVDEVNQ